uniref:Uncharacterized protein n=1 Tax=viral metagenome TaxID=1070528 RepID=A0A6M3K1B2_9ZZZZ
MTTDNVTFQPIPATPVAGTVVAADDIDGKKFQRMKIAVGADGVNDGDVSFTNPLPVLGINNLVQGAYDYISMSYTDGNLTGVVYKTGGSGGTTVATLTLAYTDGNLTSLTRT